jgi:hypothetical protein
MIFGGGIKQFRERSAIGIGNRFAQQRIVASRRQPNVVVWSERLW